MDWHAPGRVVADEAAPALDRVVEREGLAAVVAHLQPEADHLVVVEDRLLRPSVVVAFANRSVNATRLLISITSPIAGETEALARGHSKMLSGNSGREG
jgi:hypothetical protein